MLLYFIKILSVLSVISLLGCDLNFIDNTESSSVVGSFVDERDGQEYKTVKIGKQIWMKENLNFKANSGSFCYNNDNKNCDKYGRLYIWTAAMGINSEYATESFGFKPTQWQGVCPVGWLLPTKDDWDELAYYASDVMGYTQPKKKNREDTFYGVGKVLKSVEMWPYDEYYWGGEYKVKENRATDELQFTALPAGVGVIGYYDGKRYFDSLMESSFFWSSSEMDAGDATFAALHFTMHNMIITDPIFNFTRRTIKSDAYSIRCIKK